MPVPFLYHLTTYNLHVEELHNYAVGEDGILVHNTSRIACRPKQCDKGVVVTMIKRCNRIANDTDLKDCEEHRESLIDKCRQQIRLARPGQSGRLTTDQDTACPKDPKCDACSKYRYYEKPPGGGTWLAYIGEKDVTGWTPKKLDDRLEEINKGREKEIRPHGHHIAMKGDKFDENKKAREILCSVGIDPYIGGDNLVFSPNWCHSQLYATRVLKALQVAKASKITVQQALKLLAAEHRICLFDKSGVADDSDEVS